MRFFYMGHQWAFAGNGVQLGHNQMKGKYNTLLWAELLGFWKEAASVSDSELRASSSLRAEAHREGTGQTETKVHNK